MVKCKNCGEEIEERKKSYFYKESVWIHTMNGFRECVRQTNAEPEVSE